MHFLHCNDLTLFRIMEKKNLKKYKKGDKLKVKVLEIKIRSTKSKSWFTSNNLNLIHLRLVCKDKKINEATITVKVIFFKQ